MSKLSRVMVLSTLSLAVVVAQYQYLPPNNQLAYQTTGGQRPSAQSTYPSSPGTGYKSKPDNGDTFPPRGASPTGYNSNQPRGNNNRVTTSTGNNVAFPSNGAYNSFSGVVPSSSGSNQRGAGGISRKPGSNATPRRPDDSEAEDYHFKYEVLDERSRNEFGHEETGKQDTKIGSYHALLPDGRRMYVEYRADDDGYKPSISYH